jgi:GMP synthase-like glutamine amidotransferase
MRTLVIDNETRLLTELEALLPGHETIRRWNEKYDDHDGFDLVILSGGSTFGVLEQKSLLSHEYDLVLHREKPIIGICLGAELIVDAYGGTITQLSETERGQCQIYVRESSPIFGGLEQFTVNESHHWKTEKLPENFEILAESGHGVEVFKHRTKPIFGFQFHPESQLNPSDGGGILLALTRQFGLI